MKQENSTPTGQDKVGCEESFCEQTVIQKQLLNIMDQ